MTILAVECVNVRSSLQPQMKLINPNLGEAFGAGYADICKGVLVYYNQNKLN